MTGIRKGPIPMRPATLSAEQRTIYLALRQEAARPRLRLTYGQGLAWLFLTLMVGVFVGFHLGGG